MPDHHADALAQLGAGYRHVAVVGTPGPETGATVLSALRAGAGKGSPVVLACSAPLVDALLPALPDAAVHTVDPASLSGRAPDALAGYSALVDRFAPADGARVQVVTDTATPPRGGRLVWLQTEALLDQVLADQPVDHYCVLDPADLGEEADRALACHRGRMDGEGPTPNPARRDPAEILRTLWSAHEPDPLESTPPTLALEDVTDMRGLRRALTACFADGPMDPDDAEDLVLAIDEVTANAAEHGVPPVDVRVWVTPTRVLCAVADRGPGFDAPLAGYGPAHGGDLSVGGMGLWLARRAVDRMTTAPIDDDGDGCVVRLVIDPRHTA